MPMLTTILSEMANKEKKGAYRHPKDLPQDEKWVPISARIPKSISEKLGELADTHGHAVSKLVLEAIEGYLRAIDEYPGKD